METFIESIKGREKLDDFLSEHEMYVKAHMDMSDYEVRHQHSLLYKWFCKKWWGHCFPNNADSGICMRCGKKVLPLPSSKSKSAPF